jgi:hypothetical protein
VYENIECCYPKSFELMESICDQLTDMGVLVVLVVDAWMLVVACAVCTQVEVL